MHVRTRSQNRLIRIAAMLALAGTSAPAVAQLETPSEYLQINADTVQTFAEQNQQVVLSTGPIKIQTDRATFTADSAVIWFSRVEGSVLNRQRAEIALIGQATIIQGSVERSGDRLFVSTIVGGPVRMTVENRQVTDARASDLYKRATDMRPLISTGAVMQDNVLIQRPWIEPPIAAPATQPDPTIVIPQAPVTFMAQDVQTSTNTSDGTIAAVLKGGVLLLQRRPNGDLIELQAENAVLFTNLKQFNPSGAPGTSGLENAVTSAYLEGDVRVNFTPASNSTANVRGEQKLRASRVLYEFATDRAVLTDVVLQSTDPRVPLPITLRANVMKQLAQGEYKTNNTVLTTSQFAVPSYSVNASKAYVRQYEGANDTGPRTQFIADNATLRTFGVPFFYLPRVSGDLNDNAIPIRNVGLSGRRNFGFGIQTEWGLFESLGQDAPPGLDVSYNLDYYTQRGPAVGINANYQGGVITDSKENWAFNGGLNGYIVYDHGDDDLGRDRADIRRDDSDLRARVGWEHQHFFPDNWQVQLRAGYLSDPTFQEEWFESNFNNSLPTNLSAYAKRQSDTQALTFLVEYQPNNFVTTAEALQERFPGDPASSDPLSDRPYEIDRLPEVGFHRIGDSFNNDTLTFFSDNRIGGYLNNDSTATLSDYGFRANLRRDRIAVPGIASYGYTGVSDDYVGRADLRQEIDWPIDAGQFKVVPYIVGRYTGYSDSPDDGAQSRFFGGVGMRINTAFWKIDDTVNNRFFDLHRMRHVIEPEVHLFASASTVDRSDVFIYDETIDGINDISAGSFYIRQRWQTKRGAPGRERSVDVLGLNVGFIGFVNEPDETNRINPDFAAFGGAVRPVNPQSFRGLFFQSTPEASIPRSTFAADALWRISDTTLLLSDFSWNLDEQNVATTSAGLLVGRGDRVNYYTGIRYIGELNSTIASFNVSYQLTQKYIVNFGVAVDLARTDSRGGSINIVRRFDRFSLGVSASYDAVEDQSGFSFQLSPEGVGDVLNPLNSLFE
jgi:hypothetical protein